MMILTQGSVMERVNQLELGTAFTLVQVQDAGGDWVTRLDMAGTSGITQEQADLRYLLKTGDTSAGNFAIDGGGSTARTFDLVHRANVADGAVLTQTVTGQPSPRLMFWNSTDSLGAAIHSLGNTLAFSTGITPGSSSGTQRLSLSATRLDLIGGIDLAINSTQVITPARELVNVTMSSLLLTGTLDDARLSSNVPLKSGANTFTTTNTFNGATTNFGSGTLAGALYLQLFALAGQYRGLRWYSGTTIRWELRVNNGAESGSDLGSDFEIYGFSDAGVALERPFYIGRAVTGSVGIGRDTVTMGRATAGTQMYLYLSAPAGTTRALAFRSGSTNRWIQHVSSTVEGGSDAGSNMLWNAYTDAGVFIDTPLEITRASGGRFTMRRSINVTLGNTIGLGGNSSANVGIFIQGAQNAVSTQNYGIYMTHTLVATANSQTQASIRLLPTFTPGAFTGLAHYGLLVGNISGGATNYAIFTNDGDVRFGGPTILVSTLSVSGEATFLTRAGINATQSNVVFNISGTETQGSGTQQYGMAIQATSGSDATSAYSGLYVIGRSAAAAYTVASLRGIYVAPPNIGAGSTATATYGIYIDNQTGGTTNYALYTNSGLVRFGGDVSMAAALAVTGTSSLGQVVVGGLLNVTNSMNVSTTVLPSADVNDTSLLVTRARGLAAQRVALLDAQEATDPEPLLLSYTTAGGFVFTDISGSHTHSLNSLTGILSVSKGGTGISAVSEGAVLVGGATGGSTPLVEWLPTAAGQVWIADATLYPEYRFLTTSDLPAGIAYLGTVQTFSVNQTFSGQLAVTGTLLHLNSTTPRLRFTDSDGTVNQRVFDWAVNTNSLDLEARNDAIGFVRNLLTVNHSGAIAVPGNLSVTGATTLLNTLTFSGISGMVAKFTPAASGTFGASQYLAWYRANGTTRRSYLGVDSNDVAHMRWQNEEVTGTIVIGAGNTLNTTFNADGSSTFHGNLSVSKVAAEVQINSSSGTNPRLRFQFASATRASLYSDTNDVLEVHNTSGTGFATMRMATSLIDAPTTTPATASTYAIRLRISSTERLTLGSDASYSYIQSWNTQPLALNGQGNPIVLHYVSIGHTWSTTYSVLKLNRNQALMYNNAASTSAGSLRLISGLYYDGTWRLSTTGNSGTMFSADAADYFWYIAAAGTEGGAASLVERMRLDTAALHSHYMIRAGGWFSSEQGSYNGLALEIGRSTTTSYVYSYNRGTSAFGPLHFGGSSYEFQSGNTQFNGRIYVNYNSSGDNSAIIQNISSSGYGAYFRGGAGASQYLMHVVDYADQSTFLLYRGGTSTLVSTLQATEFQLSSDARKKRDFNRITHALDKVCSLDGFTFQHVDHLEQRRQAGLIAQQVRDVLPEAVGTDKDGMLTLAYDAVIPLLVEAIKELRDEVKHGIYAH